MLSPYDELPVHQTPYPVLDLQNSDPGFDDGYFFGVFSAEHRVFCFLGMRVNPNTDLVGGYAAVNVDGVQRTVRFSRTWRQACETAIGPLRIDVVEPYRDIHLTLAENGSGLAFDLHWLGVSEPVVEAHHLARSASRRTTDQTRYVQAGAAAGWIRLDDRRWDVDPGSWSGSRDHSWGTYFERPPLAPDGRWLPPTAVPGPSRSLRFWSLFHGPGATGFYAIHETSDGRQVPMNDTFGTPFEGRLEVDGRAVELVRGRHDLTLVPGTRLLAGATIHLEDAAGGAWVQRLEPACPPWVTSTIGYQAGSWRDGGSMRTYHGPGVATEWDEFDFSSQPVDHRMYGGAEQPGLYGKEYLCRVTTTAPDGRTFTGQGHTELFLDGRFDPYGLA